MFARAGPTSARRRRVRRIRSIFRHEQMAIKLPWFPRSITPRRVAVPWPRSLGMGVPPVAACAASAVSPMVDYVDPAPVSPAPVIGYVAPHTGRHLCSTCSSDRLRCARTFRHLRCACSSDRFRCARTFRHPCCASSSVRVRDARSCVWVHCTSTCWFFCCALPTVTSCLLR